MKLFIKITKLLPYSLLLLSLFTNQAFAVEEKDVAKVQNVIEAFKSGNMASIAKMVSYPLFTESNSMPINNPYEFVSRFDEVFDQNLLKSIISSDARIDWNTVGWRGIMLFDGDVWLDHDGYILSVKPSKIYAANKNANRSKVLTRGRSALHRSISNYAQSVLEWKTNHYHVRVDDMGNGSLRYASWPVNSSTINKPDIVLSNGRKEVDTTGRNHRYVFNNGNFSYHLNVNANGDQPSGLLEVFHGNQRYLRDNVREIIKNK